MHDNIYLRLTREFNDGEVRAIVSSGQAVVLHGLAIMSKDGDWIVRENQESLKHILRVLGKHGARYRFGAPLDVRWMEGGWSAHFEFFEQSLRVRTDFVTRPARIPLDRLARLWSEIGLREIPVVDPADLARIKMTNREKDYAIIGEIARLIRNPREQLLCSRSGRDIAHVFQSQPGLVEELVSARPALAAAKEGLDALEEALDRERRDLMHANERRLAAYTRAAESWSNRWHGVVSKVSGLGLPEAHRVIVEQATRYLPYQPAWS